MRVFFIISLHNSSKKEEKNAMRNKLMQLLSVDVQIGFFFQVWSESSLGGNDNALIRNGGVNWQIDKLARCQVTNRLFRLSVHYDRVLFCSRLPAGFSFLTSVCFHGWKSGTDLLWVTTGTTKQLPNISKKTLPLLCPKENLSPKWTENIFTFTQKWCF